jgi:predicted dehydrogenase
LEFLKDSDISRRDFMTRALAGLTLAGLPAWFAEEAVAAEKARIAAATRKIGPNDRINFACIGPGGSRGGFRQGLGDTMNAKNHPGTQIVAVCDVDELHRNEAAQALGGDSVEKYHDFRDLLARKDIDAVVIGVPDHWHTLIAITALKAGKDVYCEKPLTLTIDEGKHLVKVAKETGRVFQVGSQQRSDARFRLACELVRNGRLGKLKRVEAHLPGAGSGGPFPVQPVPDGFDWDMWQGQTPKVDYVKERTHGTFRYWYEYAGGMMTDWGAHHNDIAQWGIGADGSGPIHVVSTGKAPEPCGQCYNVHTEFNVTYTYPNDVTLNTFSGGENGVRFEGENGWIFVSRETIRASDPRLLSDPLPANATRLYVSNDHMGNFIECIRERKETICPAEVGHRSVTVCHLGNISLRLGGKALDWDPKKEVFVHDKEANAMLSRKQRSPWKV